MLDSAKTLKQAEENPAPARFYLGQVVPQSSPHEHNTDLSVTNLQPQRESHRTKMCPGFFALSCVLWSEEPKT